MNETIFFNPGDSIGNFHDHNDAVQMAQIYRNKNANSGSVLVVKGTNNESFDIFLADDQISHSNEVAAKAHDQEKEYQIQDQFK